MDIVFLLLPLSLILVGLMVWAVLWAIRRDQFEDFEGEGNRILMDDDSIKSAPEDGEENGPVGGRPVKEE